MENKDAKLLTLAAIGSLVLVSAYTMYSSIAANNQRIMELQEEADKKTKEEVKTPVEVKNKGNLDETLQMFYQL
jgi:hypothetical protein